MIGEYLEMAWSALSHPVADHLLQSTFCAVFAALLAVVLRRNGARTRYWIWLAASLKFLVPFALLAGIGAQAGHFLPRERGPRFEVFLDYVSVPSVLTQSGEHLPVSSERSFAAILLGAWLCGFAAVVLLGMWRWLRMRRVVRKAPAFPDGFERQAMPRILARAGVRFPVPLAVSSFSCGPAVYGILRPVLLLPEGISRHLDAAQLEAVLAHEVVHIRGRDNLLATLHMLVEAVFWFHPLVWWLGAKLMTDRERACDEEVLRMGSEPETYADAILRICKLGLASPLACVSGITGSDLKRRVENIMSQGGIATVNRWKKILLAAAGAAVLFVPVIAGLLSSPRGGMAQQIEDSKERPSFTVASIKPSDPGTQGLKLSMGPGGRVVAANVTLRFLIKIAYDLRDDQIGGGPSWLGSARYNVEGKCDPPVSDSLPKTEYQRQVRLRLQSLLAERFRLELKRDSKEMMVFDLVVAKNGPKMQEVAHAAGAKTGFRVSHSHMEAADTDMESLAHFLEEETSRVVTDKTGLGAHYAFKLDWTPDPTLGVGHGEDAPAPDLAGPSLFTALQQQLGLKLEAHRGAAEYMIVERAELPTAN